MAHLGIQGDVEGWGRGQGQGQGQRSSCSRRNRDNNADINDINDNDNDNNHSNNNDNSNNSDNNNFIGDDENRDYKCDSSVENIEKIKSPFPLETMSNQLHDIDRISGKFNQFSAESAWSGGIERGRDRGSGLLAMPARRDNLTYRAVVLKGGDDEKRRAIVDILRASQQGTLNPSANSSTYSTNVYALLRFDLIQFPSAN